MSDVDDITESTDGRAARREYCPPQSAPDITEPTDGRAARRQRNIDSVLDVVLEMFADEAMFPTMEQAAKRSGLSLRSLYRYFADPGELLEAAIKRNDQIGVELSRLHEIGQGPFERRMDDFVTMRINLHEVLGPVLRAALANATRHPRVRDNLASDRNRMRAQFEQQFKPELAERKGTDREAVAAAGDLLTQPESIGYLRRQRQFTVAQTHATLVAALRSLLS